MWLVYSCIHSDVGLSGLKLTLDSGSSQGVSFLSSTTLKTKQQVISHYKVYLIYKVRFLTF